MTLSPHCCVELPLLIALTTPLRVGMFDKFSLCCCYCVLDVKVKAFYLMTNSASDLFLNIGIFETFKEDIVLYVFH